MRSGFFRWWGLLALASAIFILVFTVVGVDMPPGIASGSLWVQALVGFGIAEVLDRLPAKDPPQGPVV